MARTKVVVFGSSSCSIDSSLYLHAMKLGELLATAGYDITNGGYSGIMEAVSLGASSVTDCTIEGVVVPQLFPGRPPRGNAYLNQVTVTQDLMQRLTRLVTCSNIFVALPGSVGTLGEVALVWNQISIDFRVRQESEKHLILWKEPFESFIRNAQANLGLTASDVRNLHFVNSPEEAVSQVNKLVVDMNRGNLNDAH